MIEIARGDVHARPPSVYSGWLRVMAALYDPFLWLGERAGMRSHRRALLAGARGRVVEIGAGTGLNMSLYPAAVDDLVLAEPEPAMRQQLSRRRERLASDACIVDAPAEQLPMADGSVDTVVATFVLCTVDDPVRALREIARVLCPGGQLLFIEHVRSTSRVLAACQDRLLRPWRGFAGGCVCNRPTLELMVSCGFAVEADAAVWRGMPAIVRPLRVGHATRPVAGDSR